MKVGHIIGGLEVIDVKRVNKLNLIQFLKDVNSYLDLGYKIDVNSGRQVGLVLSVDVFKVEDNKKEDSTTADEKYNQKDLVVKVNGEVIETDDSEVPVKKPTQRTKKTT